MAGILTTFVQLPTSASAPTPTGMARLWVKTSDGHVYFTDASNVDHDLTSGSGFDPAVWVQHNPSTSNTASNVTTGVKFQVGTASTCTGVKVYWAGPATTLRVRLYNAGGTSLATGTQAVAGAGLYTISFAASASMAASTPYWATVYDTAATNYTAAVTSVGPTGGTATNYLANPGPVSLTMLDNAYFAGDVVPATTIGSQWFATTPIYTTP